MSTVAPAAANQPGTAAGWLLGLLDVVGSQPPGARLRQCPSHEDSDPSLSITERPDGAARLKCFAGCPPEEILRALGCGLRQLYVAPQLPPDRFARLARLRLPFPPLRARRGHPAARGFRLEAVHRYGPADGTQRRVAGHRLLRWRHRSGAKELEWETRLHHEGLRPGLIGIPERSLPLYHERQVQAAVALGEPVLIVESESSVDALRGWCATTWAGGAAAVNTTRLARLLRGHRNQLLLPDHDPAGHECLRRMLAAGLGPGVLLGAAGEDARELYRRLGPARFADLVEDTLRAAYTSPRPLIITHAGGRTRQLPAARLGQPSARPAPARRPKRPDRPPAHLRTASQPATAAGPTTPGPPHAGPSAPPVPPPPTPAGTPPAGRRP